MPITSDDFKRGRTEDSYEDRITAFLGTHPGQAFNAVEIAEGAGLPLTPEKKEPKGGWPTSDERITALFDRMTRYSDITSLGVILDAFAQQGKIDARTVQTGKGGERYYMAKP